MESEGITEITAESCEFHPRVESILEVFETMSFNRFSDCTGP